MTSLSFSRLLTLLACPLVAGFASPLRAQSNPEQLPEDILDAMSETKAPLKLVAPGEAPPVIVTGTNPTPAEQFAAKELSTHLEKITGQTIKIVDETEVPQGRKWIAVGPGKFTEGYDRAALGVEEYLIDVRPDAVVILGGAKEPLPGADGTLHPRDRGTLYGVYEFLENLGVRWYRPEPWGWYIPKLQSIELPVGKKISKPPAFLGRCAVRMDARWDGAKPGDLELAETWAARQRLNVRTSHKDQYGGWVSVGLNHAHSRIISPGKYLKTHPEYFALVDGRRGNPGSGKLPQLCLGNPELQEVFAQTVIEKAKADPYSISISVDPEDGTHPARRMCTCELCKAMDDPAQPLLMSNRVFAFTNLIARKVAREVPGANVGLYAYSMHTGVPTLIDRIEPNVIVGFANINSWSDWTKKLTDPESPQNAQFLKLFNDWKKILGHRPWMREYSAYGWLGPIPMTRLLQERVQTYRKLGVEGLEWPGEPNWGPQLLLLYFKAQLQWNPDLDLQKELDLFYHNYYGPAAAPMKAYHERWMDAFEKSHLGSGLQGGVSSGGRGMHALCSPKLMEELGGYIRQAQEKVKGQPLYEQRLRGTALGYEFCRQVSEILVLKLKEGKETTARYATYLESPKAQEEWDTFKKWLLEANREDLAFEVQTRNGGAFATALTYMQRDILQNGRFGETDERAFLTACGFDAPAPVAP